MSVSLDNIALCLIGILWQVIDVAYLSTIVCFAESQM